MDRPYNTRSKQPTPRPGTTAVTMRNATPGPSNPQPLHNSPGSFSTQPTELPPISELLDLQHRLADQLVSLRDQIWRQDCQLQEFREQLHPEPLHHPQPILPIQPPHPPPSVSPFMRQMPPHIPNLQSNPTDERRSASAPLWDLRRLQSGGSQPPLHFYGAFAPPPTIAVQPSVPPSPLSVHAGSQHSTHPSVFLPPASPSSHHTPPFSPPGPPGGPPGPPGPPGGPHGPPGGPPFGGW
ncbi:hypothetical protein JB92DRAFT_2961337, partial [Gautieria morchelliformis]